MTSEIPMIPTSPPSNQLTSIKSPGKVGLLIAILIFATAIGLEVTLPTPGAAPALKSQLPSVKEKQIELIVELCKLFINWSLAIIAANTYFLKSAVESKSKLKIADLALIETGVACSIISLMCGHLAITNVVTLLEVDQFNASSVLVNRYIEFQYWLLVASLGFTVFLVHQFFWRQHASYS
jgi:hypothetical protein